MSRVEEFACQDQIVRTEWIDYSGHMNIGYYLLVFEYAARDFYAHLDLSENYRAREDCAQFAVETHINFFNEVREGDRLRLTAQLLGHDDKRNRAFYRMYHAEKGYLAATNEVMYLHVDLKARRSAPWPADARARLDAVWRTHKTLPMPEQAGRAIGFAPKKAVSAV